MSAPTKADPVVVDRIAAALRKHFNGPLYAPYAALGHDELPFSCAACYLATELAAREVAGEPSSEDRDG